MLVAPQRVMSFDEFFISFNTFSDNISEVVLALIIYSVPFITVAFLTIQSAVGLLPTVAGGRWVSIPSMVSSYVLALAFLAAFLAFGVLWRRLVALEGCFEFMLS